MKSVPPDEFLAIQSKLLERFEVVSRKVVPFCNGLQFDLTRAIHMDALVAELRGYVWSDVIQNETITLKLEASYPATWWQHFKQRWFPAWALRRWPVALTWVREEKAHRFKTVALFPEFRRYGFILRRRIKHRPGTTCEAWMPGLPLCGVRYTGRPLNIFDFPRLLIGKWGSSWVWPYAVDMAREELKTKQEHDADERAYLERQRARELLEARR